MNPIRRKESVCRRLFGPVDHEQLRRDLKQRLEEITEQDSRRWNFNFQSETPLPGRFQWKEIPADSAATFYQESTEVQDAAAAGSSNPDGDDGRLRDCEEESEGSNQENCSSFSNTPKCPAEVTPVRRKRTHAKSANKPRSNNARITDFFVKRRRTSETKNILNPFLSTSSEAAPCKTIR